MNNKFEHDTSSILLRRRCFLKSVAASSVLASLHTASAQKSATLPRDYVENTIHMDMSAAYPQEWSAEDVHYIWNSEPEKKQQLYLRKLVSCTEEPQRAILYILNDAKFALWINGQQVRALSISASWRLTSTYDITSIFKKGLNTICIQSESLNTDYHSQPLTPLSGVAARLEIFDGNELTAIQTNSSWLVSNSIPEATWKDATSSDSGWEHAKVIATANQSPWVNLKNWPKPLPDPASHSLRILDIAPWTLRPLSNHSDTTLLDADTVRFRIKKEQRAEWYRTANMTVKERLAFARENLPGIKVDFGKEVHGRIHIESACDQPMALLISLGESPGEAWNEPKLGILDVFLPANGTASTTASGYRYAHIHAIPLGKPKDASTELKIKSIKCQLIHHPVQYEGSLTSSDDMLQRLWEVGAYTVHLCAQREMWDAPKRDRNAYAGDLHPTAPILTGIFNQPQLAMKTLDVLSSGIWIKESILRHINGISGYSAAWIYGLAETFQMARNTSDISARLPFLLALLKYMESELDENHIFVNRNNQWCFTDWSSRLRESGKQKETGLFMTLDQQMATHFFYLGAFRQAAKLLKAVGETEARSTSLHYTALAQDMVHAARHLWWNKDQQSFGDRIQVNAMAIFVGALEGAEATKVADTVLLRKPVLTNFDLKNDKDIVSPYYRYYVLEALAMAGRTKEAAIAMKNFYGEMLHRGATTFWEAFDTRQVAGPDIPGYGPDWRGDNSSGENMYNVSLCHGWSSAPTSWIMRNIVGLRPAVAGFSEVLIEPELCGALWVEGKVATPYGVVSARHSHTSSQWSSQIDLPQGVTALVGIPQAVARNRKLLLNGMPIEKSSENEHYIYLKIQSSGQTIISC